MGQDCVKKTSVCDAVYALHAHVEKPIGTWSPIITRKEARDRQKTWRHCSSEKFSNESLGQNIVVNTTWSRDF